MPGSDDWLRSGNAEIVFSIMNKTGILRTFLELIFPIYCKVNKFNAREFNFYAIGQSHLDTAWNWTWDWTKRKIRKTFGNNLERLDEYPFYKFSASQPVHYEYFEKAYPSIFKRLSQYVKENRWDIVGGMYCEPDCNVPDGESLVRQRLYGQKYYYSRFGKISRVAWLPDTFGFSWSLPQIFLKSGSPYFHTTKLTWNLEHEFPFSVFWWKGPDESMVLSHNFQNGFRALERVGEFKKKTKLVSSEYKSDQIEFSYNTDFEKTSEIFAKDPNTKTDIEEINENSDHNDSYYIKDFGHFYGFGDGGAGPLIPELLLPEVFRRSKSWQFVKAGVYFKRLEKEYGDRIPVWNDELYLEVHRGCQTTFYSIKKNNRIAEALLPKYEKLIILSSYFTSYFSEGGERILKYDNFDPNLFDNCWKKLLFNQFHDILPGSSIEEVYTDAENDYNEIFSRIEQLHGEIEKKIENAKKDDLINLAAQMLFQPNHWRGKTILPNKDAWSGTSMGLFDEANFKTKRYKFRLITKNFRGIGFQLISRTESITKGYSHAVIRKEKTIEISSPQLEVVFDTETTGIISLKSAIDDFSFDYAMNNQENRLNQLKLFVDEPESNDAWNLDKNYRFKQIHNIKVEKYEVFSKEEENPYTEMRFFLKINNSRAILSYIFHDKLPCIICKLSLDYQEQRKLLRVEFDSSIISEIATTSLAYGMIDRPTIPKQTLEKGRWEFPGQKFISISDGTKGLSLVCENRYGFSAAPIYGNNSEKDRHDKPIGTAFGMSLKKAPLYGNPDSYMRIEENKEAFEKNPKLLEIAAIPEESRQKYKDLGFHDFTWFIIPHDGTWREAGIYQQYYNLTDTPLLLDIKKKPLERPALVLIDTDLENVRISTIKPEFGTNKNLVLRLFEYGGEDSSGNLYIHPSVLGLHEMITEHEEIDVVNLEKPDDDTNSGKDENSDKNRINIDTAEEFKQNIKFFNADLLEGRSFIAQSNNAGGIEFIGYNNNMLEFKYRISKYEIKTIVFQLLS